MYTITGCLIKYNVSLFNGIVIDYKAFSYANQPGIVSLFASGRLLSIGILKLFYRNDGVYYTGLIYDGEWTERTLNEIAFMDARPGLHAIVYTRDKNVIKDACISGCIMSVASDHAAYLETVDGEDIATWREKRIKECSKKAGTIITNKEWLSTLSAEEWWDKVQWLLNEYGTRWNNTRLGVIGWLEEGHEGSKGNKSIIDTTQKCCKNCKHRPVKTDEYSPPDAPATEYADLGLDEPEPVDWDYTCPYVRGDRWYNEMPKDDDYCSKFEKNESKGTVPNVSEKGEHHEH